METDELITARYVGFVLATLMGREKLSSIQHFTNLPSNSSRGSTASLGVMPTNRSRLPLPMPGRSTKPTRLSERTSSVRHNPLLPGQLAKHLRQPFPH